MDDEGVSEVVGQILMFGILSMVLVLSLLSFNVAKETAEDRVLGTTSDSVAQRIASLVVSTALFAENLQDMSPELESRLELPGSVESRDYEITSEGSRVTVKVVGTLRQGTAPYFAAGSTGVVHTCAQEPFEGGSVRIRVVPDSNYPDGTVNIDDENGDPAPLTACSAVTPESQLYVYLEPAP